MTERQVAFSKDVMSLPPSKGFNDESKLKSVEILQIS